MNNQITFRKILSTFLKSVGFLVSGLLIIGFIYIFYMNAFYKIDVGYEIHGNKIQYNYELDGDQRRDILEGTPDTKTFSAINATYAKDRNHVWYQHKIINGADINTFTVFSYPYYSKDKNHVYSWGKPIIDADPNTFQFLECNTPEQVLKCDEYTKDKNHIYFNDKILAGAKPSYFRFLRCGYCDYAKDDEHVFYLENLIENADAKTFVVEDSITINKDGSTTYHIDNPIVKDANAVYDKGKKIK